MRLLQDHRAIRLTPNVTKFDQTFLAGHAVTGSIISNMLVFHNVCKLMTRSLHRALDRREGWESRVGLDHAVRKELEFWKSSVFHLNSRCFADAIRRPSRIVY